MNPVIRTLVLAGVSATAVCASQTPGGAGALTINGGSASGGVATLDVARRILLTLAGNETGKTFVLTGTDRNGNRQSESLAGTAAGTIQSLLDYKTVTSLTISAAAAGAITVGTSSVGSSAWVVCDHMESPFQIGIACVASGTVNYSVEYTYDDPSPAVAIPNVFTHSILNGLTATTDSTIDNPIRAYRLTLNSGSGTVVMTGIQAGPHA